jgi:5-methylcytosine-specific restriction endonuclease McrA
MFLRIVRRDNQTCQICGKYLKEDEIEIDHIVPFSQGGPTEESNLRVLCKDCNRKKQSSIEN